jgi:hypothetical protein
MLAGQLGAGRAGDASGTTAATDLRGGEGRCQIQNPNPRKTAARIRPEIHFRRLRMERQRFAT